MDSLVETVGAVLQFTKQCQTTRARQCNLKRETPSIAHDCGFKAFETCSMVYYVQATAVSIFLLFYILIKTQVWAISGDANVFDVV